MTLEEEIDATLAYVSERVRVVSGNNYAYPTLRRDNWYSFGWRLTSDFIGREMIDVRANTLAEVLQKAREAADNLVTPEQRLAEILGVDHAQAA